MQDLKTVRIVLPIVAGAGLLLAACGGGGSGVPTVAPQPQLPAWKGHTALYSPQTIQSLRQDCQQSNVSEKDCECQIESFEAYVPEGVLNTTLGLVGSNVGVQTPQWLISVLQGCREKTNS
jgi:hypothetical protein